MEQVTWDCIRQFLYDWQTLISGTLALIAAGTTIAVMRSQMSAEKDRHRDALYRKGLAARAQMPDALSGISRFVETCVMWAARREPVPPAAPTDAINALKNAIEFVDNETAKTVFELVSFYQVHNARLFAYTPPIAGPEAADRLYESTRLIALVNRLFPYARNEVQKAPQEEPSQEDMMNALKAITGIGYRKEYAERYGQVCERITKKHS